ncbi:twin-arginine translocation signal domain-containing protein, partial [Arenibacter sp. 6A1]|nr:twin-arginine translocation signal domain-containing protein [Arenibacter sp. 6A1]
MNHRRNFIKKTAITSAGIAILPNISLGKSFKRNTEKLKVAVLGIGLRGT